MDERTATVEAVPEASAPPWQLELALWVPVTAAIAWFFVRLASGRWIGDTPGPR